MGSRFLADWIPRHFRVMRAGYPPRSEPLSGAAVVPPHGTPQAIKRQQARAAKSLLAARGAVRQRTPAHPVSRDRQLRLRARHGNFARAPLRYLMLAENGDGPVVAIRSCRPGIADSASRPALEIDHQLGTRTEPPPSTDPADHPSQVPSAKFARELSKAIRAALRHEEAHPAQPAIPQRSGTRPAPAHQHVSADKT